MIIHTVSPGDSIFSIARQYSVPPTRLITDNLLSQPGHLVVGQDLLILFPTVTHTVRGGDTLSAIAARYDTTLLGLYQYNPVLGGQPQIFPGQVLNIAYALHDAPTTVAPITVIGQTAPTIDRTLLCQTLPYLTYLSICGYCFREDGSLFPQNDTVAELFALAQTYGVLPLPMVQEPTYPTETLLNYGIDRPLADATTPARILSNDAAVEQAWEKQVTITYDAKKEAPTYRYYDRPSTYPDAIAHEVWFQNARSTKAQLSRLAASGIGEIGVMDLQHPYPALWTLVTQMFGIRNMIT